MLKTVTNLLHWPLIIGFVTVITVTNNKLVMVEIVTKCISNALCLLLWPLVIEFVTIITVTNNNEIQKN